MADWRWSLVAVLSLAAVLRAVGLEDWSLWQDEEISIYYSQHLERPFALSSLFFPLLNVVYRVTGVSIVAGRVVSGFFGLLSIWLLYLLVSRHASRPAGLAAALLASLCLGHVFWSQSIRYYTLLLCFQLVAILWLYEGFEEGRLWKVLFGGLALDMAMVTHGSAILMLPALGLYVVAVLVSGRHPAAFSVRACFMLALILAAGAALVLPSLRILKAGGVIGDLAVPAPAQPVLLRFAAYSGAPIVALALVAPLRWRSVPARFALLLAGVAFVPVALVVLLGHLQRIFPIWYHGLVSILGFAGMAGIALIAVGRSWPRVAASLGVLSVLYYAGFLYLYFTSMHGDRPRWREATEFVRQATHVEVAVERPSRVFSTAPEIVAYYLGVPADRTVGNALVANVSGSPPQPAALDEWYVVRAGEVSGPEAFLAWLASDATEVARFQAATWTADRTVIVYRRQPARQ